MWTWCEIANRFIWNNWTYARVLVSDLLISFFNCLLNIAPGRLTDVRISLLCSLCFCRSGLLGQIQLGNSRNSTHRSVSNHFQIKSFFFVFVFSLSLMGYMQKSTKLRNRNYTRTMTTLKIFLEYIMPQNVIMFGN